MWDKTKKNWIFKPKNWKCQRFEWQKKKNEIDEVVFFRLFAFENGLCLSSDNNRYILDRANEYEWAHTFKHSQ